MCVQPAKPWAESKAGPLGAGSTGTSGPGRWCQGFDSGDRFTGPAEAPTSNNRQGGRQPCVRGAVLAMEGRSGMAAVRIAGTVGPCALGAVSHGVPTDTSKILPARRPRAGARTNRPRRHAARHRERPQQSWPARARREGFDQRKRSQRVQCSRTWRWRRHERPGVRTGVATRRTGRARTRLGP